MYTWTDDNNREVWEFAMFATIQECIEDAKEHYFMKQGESIYIGKCEDVTIGGYDFKDILSSVETDMNDQVGGVSKSWDICSTTGDYANRQPIYEKYNKKIRKLIEDYIKEINEFPTFCKIDNIQEVLIK